MDLSELNRLIQGLQALEVGQAFTNGDLKRIISIQVGLLKQPEQILHPLLSASYADNNIHDNIATVVCKESFTGEAEKAEVRKDVGPLTHAVQSRSPGNGKNGP